MAVKERKQITGTTAQIQAYKGHEGQIVWDKEKKTLVGMSGTAGKNYPLAPQAYVDNEVSKVNAEVAKKASSAELAQGLAGKEDKGVCLPKTGGELTGSLAVKGGEGNGVLYQKDNGASIFLFDPTNPTYKGGFIIRAKDTVGGDWDLKGMGDGSLSWIGRDVDVIESQGGDWIRYRSGIQICWGYSVRTVDIVNPWGAIYAAHVPNPIVFPVPFKGNPIVAVNPNNNNTPLQGCGVYSTDIRDIWYWWAYSDSGRNVTTSYIAIGRWK